MKKLVLSVVLSLSFPALADFHWSSPVHVKIAPPALKVEIRTAPPSPRHHWIAGHWAWRNNAHVWINGQWALPPGFGYVWEPAEWMQEKGEWIFYEGHWRSAETPDPQVVYQPPSPPLSEVVVEAPPPAPLVEVRTAVPFSGAIWVPGFWNWTGSHHVWVGGRWSAAPFGHAWEEGRWEKEKDNRWHQRPGHWHPSR